MANEVQKPAPPLAPLQEMKCGCGQRICSFRPNPHARGLLANRRPGVKCGHCAKKAKSDARTAEIAAWKAKREEK